MREMGIGFYQRIKYHWPALVGALVIGALFVFPQLYFRFQLGPDFKGAYLGGTDSEQYYPRIQEVYEGKFRLTHPAMFEGKDLPYSNTPLGEITAASLGMLLGLNSREAVVAGNFVFPALIFLVFYFLSFSLTSQRLLSVTLSVGMMLATNFIWYPVNVLDLFLNQENIRVNLYNRPIHPQVSSLYFFTWLLVFWSFIRKNIRTSFRPTPAASVEGSGEIPALPDESRGRSHDASRTYDEIHRQARNDKFLLVGSGILFGLLFYVYPFSWMLAAVSQGLVGLYFLWKKDWKMVKQLVLSGLIGLIIAIPFFINLRELLMHPWYDTLVKSQAFSTTRKPLFSIFLFTDVLCLLALRFWLKVKSRAVFFLSILTGSLILLINQQVISNLSFFPGHWHWYYITPLTIFILVYTATQLLNHWPRIRNVFCVVLIGIFLANGVIAQKNHYRDASPPATIAQRFVPVYDWLNTHAEPESVVLVEEQFSSWIPFYTKSNKYFFTFLDTLSLVSAERLRHNLMVSLYLQGARADNVDTFINQHTPEFHFVLYGFWRHKQFGCKPCFPDEEIQSFKQEYLEFLRKNLRDEIKRYRADYLVLDSKGKWNGNVNGKDFLKEEAVLGDFTIYQIN